MAKISYKDFRARLRREIWPAIPGEARNLVSVHNAHFNEAMSRAGKYVRCLQGNQTSVWPFCSTYVECGKTIVQAPIGKISKVYTIANDEWCDPVHYSSWSPKQLNCWVKDLQLGFTAPSNTGYPALQQGYKYAESSTDLEFGRARVGAWAIERGRLLVAPWIQSYEKLVVEWDGIRKSWEEEDQVDDELWDADVARFIKLFVEFEHESQFGCDRKKKLDLRLQTDEQLAEIIHNCDERIRAQVEQECENAERRPSSAEVNDDAEPDEEADFVVAQIADYGHPSNGTNPQDVADLVASFDPDIVITAGDNQYSAVPDYEANVEPLYGDYITDDLTTNRFWPSLGNHDANPQGSADYSLYKAFFTLPNNERYYDVAFKNGLIHFFFYSSEAAEPDGRAVGSKQYEWFRAKMLLSTARWKVAVVHNPPYSDLANDFPGITDLRLPYADLGADLVMSGDFHAYARYEVDGLPYIVNGAGGAVIDGDADVEPQPNALDDYRQEMILDTYGAVKMNVNNDSLICRFYAVGGSLMDTLTLEK